MQKTLAYLFHSNYEKLEKCNPTFRRDNFFPSSPNIDKSVSTQRFSQRREKISLSYPKLGIKVFMELWETHLRRPMLSPPQRIPVQLLLYKTTIRPATTFFVSQMKKSLSKTTTLNTLSSKEMQDKHKEQCIKNKCLYLFIFHLLLLFNAKFV